MTLIGKIITFTRQREHYKNRLKLRNGKHIWFLFSKKIDEKQVLQVPPRTPCEVWKFRNHLYITQNYQMQTYIKK